MINKNQVTFLNYLFPVLMIAVGLRHYIKHGVDAFSVLPFIFGCFALYLALFNHRLLQCVLDLLTKAWFPIGQLISLVLLTIVYFIIFAPVGIFLRLFKKDLLNKGFKLNQLTYWVSRSKAHESNYTQQF